MNIKLSKSILLCMLTSAVQQVYADSNENFQIKPVLDLSLGLFSSDKSYSAGVQDSSPSWQEAYAKYGFEGAYFLKSSSVYFGANAVSSATFGDGDAAGYSNGSERRTALEKLKVGWKNSVEKGAEPTLDVSLGRQKVVLGDGFIVSNDALNLGKGVADGELDRGGAYYLTPRQSFEFAAVIDYSPIESLKTRWAYLKSDNKAQYEPEMIAADWQYQRPKYSLGFTYLNILELNDNGLSLRHDLKDYALRGKYKLTEQLEFSAEAVYQEQKKDTESAGYAKLSYQLPNTAFTPELSYRYSVFSDNYDSLFYGNPQPGFGTWFQGEIAGSYAGPFNTNAYIHQISLQAYPSEKWIVGLLGYKFDSKNKNIADLNAYEIDAFAVYMPTPQISVVPLFGLYNPKQDSNSGGSQMLDNKMNMYGQLTMQYSF